MNSPHVPKYCHHKATGQAFVNVPLGKGTYQKVYLGKHGTPESRARYDRVIAQWLNRNRAPKLAGPEEITVEALAAEYLSTEARQTYQARDPETGKVAPTEMIHRVTSALRPVVELFGQEPAAEFGPRAFQAVRRCYVEKGYTRKYCNSLANCVRAFLGWAVGQELIPGAKAYAIKLIKNWRPEQTTAPDNADVEPADTRHVRAVQKIVSSTIRDMIEVQLLSGARPGEVCRLTPAKIDRAGPIWFGRFGKEHKTGKKGFERTLWFGPRCQKVLRRYLRGRQPEAFLFSPRETELARLAALGQEPRTRAGSRYWVSSYSRAIRLACDRLGIPRFHPHQLRHTAATELCDQFGKAVAQTILGHATSAMTDRYDSKRSGKKLRDANRAIKKVG